MNPISPNSMLKLPRLRSNYPSDILIEIFKRIPVETLIKLSLVRKSWYSLIISPIFMSAHRIYMKNLTNQQHMFKEPLNVLSESPTTEFTVFDFSRSTDLTDAEKYVCPVSNNHFVACSNDGLVCMFDFYSTNPRDAPLILWNPSIRKACSVPPPVGGVFELLENGFPRLIFGTGFDPVSNQYVVVRIAYCNGDSERTLLRGDVYGLSVEEWKRLEEASVLCSFSTIRWKGVCFNGIIHWVGNLNVNVRHATHTQTTEFNSAEIPVDVVDRLGPYFSYAYFMDLLAFYRARRARVECGRSSPVEDVCRRSILTFKLGSGDFGVMDLPKEVAFAVTRTVSVVTVPNAGGEDLLGIIESDGDELNMWVMIEYGSVDSWVKICNFDLHSKLSINDTNVATVSSEFVAVRDQFLSCWIFYREYVEDQGLLRSIPLVLDYVDKYVESLVLFDHQSGVMQSHSEEGSPRLA